jgi:hypothetical protein
MPMRLTLVALFFLLPVSVSAAAQATAGHRPFVNKGCGFQARIPAGWRIQPSPSMECVLTVIAQHRSDGDLELLVRDGTLDAGADDLGFTKDNGKCMLQGEEYGTAVQIESASWIGLQGSVATRVYEKRGYSGLGEQTRAVLFDRKHRVAEVTCYVGEELVPEFVKGFEFLSESPH